MPRRSTRAPAEVPEGERRVTRRSLQAAATPEKAEKPDPKAAAKGRAAQPSPSPRSRGRGRATGRGKKGKEEEAEEETEEPEKSQEEPEAGAGDSDKKPAKGRGRGRGKAAAAKAKPAAEAKPEAEEAQPEEEKESAEKEEAKPEEKEEAKPEAEAKEAAPKEEEGEAAAEKKEEEEKATPASAETTPRKGRGRRSAGVSPAKAETPPSSGRSSRSRTPRKLPEETPTRRSGRTRKSAGGEEETTPKKDAEAKPEEAEATEAAGQKRKREDEETPEVAEKKQKTEEAEAPPKEEAMEVEETKAVEEKEKPTEVASLQKKISETPPEEKVPEEAKKEEPIPAVEEPSKSEESSQPEVSKTEEAKEKSEPAQYPAADEPEKQGEEAMDTAPPAEEVKQPEPVQEAEPDVNEYVMVNKDEVPAADSAEVVGALPKEETTPAEPAAATPLEPSAPPAQQDETPATSQPVSVIQETPAAPAETPTQNGGDDASHVVNEHSKNEEAPPSNNSNNIDSVAQETGATIPDPLFRRHYVVNPNMNSQLAADPARKFSVASYNILADCHAPLSKYPWITPDHLSQEFRHKKLLQELQFLDADVICLQEVGPQYYENTLKPTLRALGYEGSFMKRVDDAVNEGEATFVRSSRFTVLASKGLALKELSFKELEKSGMASENLEAVKRFLDKPSVVLLSQLRCNNTGTAVTIGNIHVSWEELKKPDLQCTEVTGAINELVATATPQGAFLLCGDFNSWPGSPVYQLTKDGYLNDQSTSELQGVNNVRLGDGSLSPLINMWWKGFQHTGPNLKSAYHEVLESEPHSTRYPNNGSVKAVDFVWYSGSTIEAAGVLQAVAQDQIASGIPNAFFPSDHISLKADLLLK